MYKFDQIQGGGGHATGENSMTDHRFPMTFCHLFIFHEFSMTYFIFQDFKRGLGLGVQQVHRNHGIGLVS